MEKDNGLPSDGDERIEQIRARYVKFMQGGQFIAETEECDEDGSRCPTGMVGFLEAPGQGYPDDDPYSPSIICFDDKEDAITFVELLKDHATMLAELDAETQRRIEAEADRDRFVRWAKMVCEIHPDLREHGLEPDFRLYPIDDATD